MQIIDSGNSDGLASKNSYSISSSFIAIINYLRYYALIFPCQFCKWSQSVNQSPINKTIPCCISPWSLWKTSCLANMFNYGNGWLVKDSNPMGFYFNSIVTPFHNFYLKFSLAIFNQLCAWFERKSLNSSWHNQTDYTAVRFKCSKNDAGTI